MKQLLVPQEMKDAMNISFLDWASRFEGLLQGDFEALQRAAMPTSSLPLMSPRFYLW